MINRITANPKILGGKPIIEGTSLSVEFILELLASDVSEDEILADYPHITKNDIHACFRYAAQSYKKEMFALWKRHYPLLTN
ncbi:Antitoxin [Candidatus Magnetomoraceae bacterium gMMP-15]